MKPEQQRAILESAAKVCGISGSVMGSGDIIYENDGVAIYWNPIANSADTGWMCAKLNINYTWMCGYVECWKWDGPSIKIEHDDTDAGKEAAWRLAASVVAAKVGGYSE